MADGHRVHSPQDLTVVSSAHNCTAIDGKLVFMVQHNYVRQEMRRSGSTDAFFGLCCLPRRRQPRVGYVLLNVHLCYRRMNTAAYSHPFDPQPPRKREERIHQAGETDEERAESTHDSSPKVVLCSRNNGLDTINEH